MRVFLMVLIGTVLITLPGQTQSQTGISADIASVLRNAGESWPQFVGQNVDRCIVVPVPLFNENGRQSVGRFYRDKDGARVAEVAGFLLDGNPRSAELRAWALVVQAARIAGYDNEKAEAIGSRFWVDVSESTRRLSRQPQLSEVSVPVQPKITVAPLPAVIQKKKPIQVKTQVPEIKQFQFVQSAKSSAQTTTTITIEVTPVLKVTVKQTQNGK